MAYYYGGRYDDAIASVEKAFLGGAKDKSLGYSILGKSYSAKGDKDKAREYVKKLRALGDDSVAAEIEAEIEGKAW